MCDFVFFRQYLPCINKVLAVNIMWHEIIISQYLKKSQFKVCNLKIVMKKLLAHMHLNWLINEVLGLDIINLEMSLELIKQKITPDI